MSQSRRMWAKRIYVTAFLVLTSLCWCPWAYGMASGRPLVIPTWAVLAYVFAAALFVLEWVFLFHSSLAVSDEELGGIVADLEAAGADESPAAAEASEEGER